MVIECLRRHAVPLTADEISRLIDRPFISVRPRVSELHQLGLIKDSGERKTGLYKVAHTAWELATPQDGSE
jgi:DNA-binding IclR family transcriptional regulator